MDRLQAHADDLAQRILVAEKLIGHGTAEQSNFVGAAHVLFAEDGSVIELRYFIFADSMETEHRAPAPQIAMLADQP